MAWKYFNYECSKCKHVYASLVDDRAEEPDPCPECGGTVATKTVHACKAILSYVPDYPGANYHRAGYTHLRRPAEKAGRQVAMSAALPPSAPRKRPKSKAAGG